MAPQTAWQLLQIMSFMVGDFQGLLQDNDSTSLPAPQYAEAPSGAHYQIRNKERGEPRGQQQHPVYSRLLGCANWSHCICPRTSSSRPGGRGAGVNDIRKLHHRTKWVREPGPGRRTTAPQGRKETQGQQSSPRWESDCSLSSSLLLFLLCAFHLLSLPSNLASSHHLPAVSVPLFVLRGYAVSQLSLPLLCIFIFISLFMIITKRLPF